MSRFSIISLSLIALGLMAAAFMLGLDTGTEQIDPARTKFEKEHQEDSKELSVAEEQLRLCFEGFELFETAPFSTAPPPELVEKFRAFRDEVQEAEEKLKKAREDFAYAEIAIQDPRWVPSWNDQFLQVERSVTYHMFLPNALRTCQALSEEFVKAADFSDATKSSQKSYQDRVAKADKADEAEEKKSPPR